ncbi:DUF6878 family protein [uncultured Hyphomicrobium sp.]|jgi:hypothetical protein|uniref:DUF6878 family protein n=1 Tax=uncultured Hyphomicrobium sp. TaxID=194373 RepID=UPI0025E2E044|nr:DUF6878 family protein [uncultured Hyphomicrobium sp.]
MSELHAAKADILHQLQAVGFTKVFINYDGEGDQGQISDIEALEPVEVKIKLMREGVVVNHHELADALETFAWKLLDEHHAGFEINDGGFGTITIDVAKGTIELIRNSYYTSYLTELVGV